ncbi:DUF3997 domain-containing protein [Compostibacter hankyongensis]|uniref:DUF3997 domain-containing protein n=1 Tax=Compostibacter hankyongensis TaxID=1007089 RepID=A0ABP8G1F4_9BACT
MKNCICLIFFFAFILIGCLHAESEYDLGNGYYLLGENYNTTISKIDDNNPAFFDDIILGRIIDCQFDKNFIIVYRNASLRAKVYFNLQDSLWETQRGKDSLQYWIIEKRNDVVIGPLTKNEYLLRRKELDISGNLKLNPISE